MIGRALVIAALLCGSVGARAEDARSKARSLYDRGMAHYNVGDYDAAAGEFKQAYELTRAPGLLFNLAQACRLAKRNDDALHFYRSYLRERPNAPNKKDVKAFIAELEKPGAAPAPARVEAPTAAPVEPAPAPVVEAPPPPPARVEPPAPERPERIEPRLAPAVPLVTAPPPARRAPYIAAAAVVGGLGLGALAAGGWFAASATQASNDISGATSWNAGLQQRWDDGHLDAQVATALFVVGGTATAVGVVLAVVAARKGPRRLAVTPPAAPGALGWSCAF